MQVGIGLPNTINGISPDALLDWMRQAEAGPFSSLAVLDRVEYDSYDPLTTLAAAAAITERIRLASMVIIGPLRNTAILAKTAASIDALSKGRLTLGIAIGARKSDYDITNSRYNNRGDRLSQQLSSLRDHWENEAIGPRPFSPTGPELLVGGISDITFERVSRYADGFMHNGGSPRYFSRQADKARAAWLDAGRPGSPKLWGMGYFALGDDEVTQGGADYLREYYAFTGPFAEKITEDLLTTPQAITQFVRGYAEAGCNELVLYPTTNHPDQLQRLADIVG
ncbi:MAG: LLM class flavin-dependent oxidoreductase [Chloroflexota bacterium]